MARHILMAQSQDRMHQGQGEQHPDHPHRSENGWLAILLIANLGFRKGEAPPTPEP